eukprot:UN11637
MPSGIFSWGLEHTLYSSCLFAKFTYMIVESNGKNQCF